MAVSAESAADSRIMKDRKKAPYLFIADHSLDLINAFDIRNGNIAHPGFVLLHFGQVVWKRNEMKYLRLNVDTILHRVKAAQQKRLSAISTGKRSADE